MKNKTIIIGLCILFLISSVTAISNKDRILQLLSNYEEECLEYKYIDKVYYIKECKHYTDYGTVWDSGTCDSITGEGYCCKNAEKVGYLGVRIQRIVEKIKTNECIKWHLVRYKK